MASGDPAPGLPERVETVLLDAGGVLLDLDYAYVVRLLQARGIEADPAGLSRAETQARKEIHRAVEAGERVSELWREYFHIILGRAGLAGAAHEGVIDSLWEAHQRVGLWTVAIPGALPAVAELKQRGLRLAVVSNAEGRVAQDLDRAGFEGLFATVVDSHLVGVQKPDPAIFAIALERLGEPARATAVFVGDVPAVDVRGAQNAGLSPILIDPHEFYPDCPATRLRSIAELPALLDGRCA